MKKFFFILLLGFATKIFAISLATSTNINVLYVNVLHNGSWSGWNSSADIYPGDQVWFQIHSYANGGDITALTSKLENIENIQYRNGDSENVTGIVNAENADKLTDFVRLSFHGNIKLKYSGYRWAVKKKGKNPEANEHYHVLPNNQDGHDVLSPAGVYLGGLQEEYRSNVLVFFQTIGYVDPINGECGVEKNKCIKGVFKDVKDDTVRYKWICKGLNFGLEAECNLNKGPIDGTCSTKINSCKAGAYEDLLDDKVNYYWGCNGLNGGKDIQCSAKKQKISAICGKKNDTCVRGIYRDVSDTYEQKRWKCLGINGGKDRGCAETKMCPCKLDKETKDKIKIDGKDEDDLEYIDEETLNFKEKNKDLMRRLISMNEELIEKSKIPDWFWVAMLTIFVLTFILTRKLYNKEN